MAMKLVTSTEFQRKAGRFLDEARKEPIGIQKHGRKSHVLVDAEEYARLKALDNIVDDSVLEALIDESDAQFSEVYEELAK